MVWRRPWPQCGQARMSRPVSLRMISSTLSSARGSGAGCARSSVQRASSCRRRRGGEVELAAPAGPGEAVEILGAQDPRKRLDGKEEALPGRTPAVAVGRKATGGDLAVDMDVLSQVLAPGMQHQGETDLAADPLRVPAEGQQGLRRGLEPEPIEPAVGWRA